MKTRSKRLYQFLKSQGALDKGSEAIELAKTEYRRQYLREYKKHYRTLKKQIQFTLATKDFVELKYRAQESRTSAGGLAREMVQTQLRNDLFIPNKKTLLEVLQGVSMSINYLNQWDRNGNVSIMEIEDCLYKAERILIEYLNQQ